MLTNKKCTDFNTVLDPGFHVLLFSHLMNQSCKKDTKFLVLFFMIYSPDVWIQELNGLQGFGTTAEVGGIENLGERFEAFGFATTECDGHAVAAIEAELERDAPGPRAILLRTVKGKGVSFMENELAWHYLPLDAAQFELACTELEAK